MTTNSNYDIAFAVNIIKENIDNLIIQVVNTVTSTAPNIKTLLELCGELNDDKTAALVIETDNTIKITHRGVIINVTVNPLGVMK